MKRNAPNFITFLRIIGALWLCFIRPFTTAFYVVYTICGISDMLDGWVARMTGSAGEFGAKAGQHSGFAVLFSDVAADLPSSVGQAYGRDLVWRRGRAAVSASFLSYSCAKIPTVCLAAYLFE